VFYLNDDYEGGELFFPNKKISIKPPKNSLLIFDSSNKDKLHGVAPVVKGTRYTIASFIWPESL
jgi:predicted 2-oxoglutarate/Fe(II)-dependent dioxygenase YbiX